jgi:selenocysteine lyase/cysteine desulfurase
MASLPVYKVRPNDNAMPYRWETGTPTFELIAGIGGALDYLSDFGGTAGLVLYERELVAHLIEVLKRFEDVEIKGITDPARYTERVPTVVFTHKRYAPIEVARRMASENIYVWNGNYYAVEIMKRLSKPDGMVRVGLAHYNTHAEIEKFEAAMKKL